MPYQDFRQFLDVLRQLTSDEVRIISLFQHDGPYPLVTVQSRYRHGAVIVFTQNGTEFPLVAGVYSTRSKALLAFQADEKTILQKVLDGLDNPIAPVVVNGAAPCHEVLIEGDDIDISRFPIPYSPKDGGSLHHARHRGVEGPGDRHPRHQALSFPDPRQGHVLVLGAAEPPLRQAPGEVSENGRHAPGPRSSSASIRSSPIPARCRPPTRPMIGRWRADCAARRSN